jgi:restriction system protein
MTSTATTENGETIGLETQIFILLIGIIVFVLPCDLICWFVHGKKKYKRYILKVRNEKMLDLKRKSDLFVESKDVETDRNEPINKIKKRGLAPQKKKLSSNEMEQFMIACNELLHKQDMQEQNASNVSTNSECIASNEDYSTDLYESKDYDSMDGHTFEYFCANLLKNNGFINVTVTPGSGDHGVDILAEKDGISYAIQCKCYSSNINNAAVQQANAGKCIYKKDIAVVLTNQYFTNQAKEEAKILGVKLWDRNYLNSLMNA